MNSDHKTSITKKASAIGAQDLLFMIDQVLDKPEAYIIKNPFGKSDEIIIPFANTKQAHALKNTIRQFCSNRNYVPSGDHVILAMCGDNGTMEWEYDDHARTHKLLPEEILSQEKPEYGCLSMVFNEGCVSIVQALQNFREELSRSLQASDRSLPTQTR
jgi:hypothetical protein